MTLLIGLLITSSACHQLEKTQNKSVAHAAMIRVPGGTMLKQFDDGTTRTITVKSFLFDADLVTVKQFDDFVKATSYVTDAQKFGNSAVFDFEKKTWKMLNAADYLHPQGKDKAQANLDHPVTQVSWNDAEAYAKWKSERLPTELEWEWAARNASNARQTYTWGEHLVEGGKYKANTWQGSFPEKNTEEDGFLTTSPVGYFGRNQLGLSDMGGNVWQWCSDKVAPTAEEAQNDTAQRRVSKGGSFLCDPNVCHGFLIVGSSSSTPETSLMHTGFRCAKD
ncbi:formylglycine-generating enzyme family protein [Solitalea sp. MAHUQ-68]|uniref:Formylglycine-generating enzyme family protein n=1 Tax=Solitalea agri TaxID=2953739 RepID=A0A9X2F1P7_9SPHI|nr:SUMF1/EgtB/PvdO family nonheme iron enzyme [Solitalea agri]MCO4292545.1 formylglycine-generating enzyme family protein [Solitalea agri]